MSNCYCVELTIKPTSDKRKLATLLKNYITKNPLNADFSLEKWKDEGVGTRKFEDLIKIMLAGWKSQPISINTNKDGFITIGNGFNASYGWKNVMVGMFEAMAPLLANDSSLNIDEDEGGSNYTVKDGKVDMGEDENENRFNVPQHGFTLTLDDGREQIIDLSDEDDFYSIMKSCGKIRLDDPINNFPVITNVFDCETEDNLDPKKWYEEYITPYLSNC